MTVNIQPQPSPAPKPGSHPPLEAMGQPLVLTLRLDKTTEKVLTTLRTRFFPSHRNFLPAHITLFHALPSTSIDQATTLLTHLSHRTPPFTVGVNSPFPLGKKGVGLHIASRKLRDIHAELQEDLNKEGVQLTEQDARKLSPHVTVQNKVGEEEAKKSLAVLKEEWKDGPARAEGLVLWRYEVGGAWTFLREFEFMPERDASGGGKD